MPKKRIAFVLIPALALWVLSSDRSFAVESTQVIGAGNHVSTNAPALTPPPAAPILPVTKPLPPGILTFDSEAKKFETKNGEPKLDFAFYLTNASPSEVTVTDVKGSCFCTVAKLPVTLPWKIPPGGGGPVPFTMDLVGKAGLLYKTVTIYTDEGIKPLSVQVNIIPLLPQPMTAAERKKNQQLAKGDRQAIFKGECARCHVEPVIGKVGKDLYVNACGICHEAEHRATMVPDLRNLPNDTNTNYWQLMVTLGKPNTLMAAFAQNQGGPLSDMQITSLVNYLAATMPAQGTNSRALSSRPKN